MTSLQLLLDPGYRLPLLLGGVVVVALSQLAILLVGSRLLLTGIALAQAGSVGAACGLFIPLPPTFLAMSSTTLAAGFVAVLRQTETAVETGLLLLYLGCGVVAQLLAAMSGSGDSQTLELLNGQLLLATGTDVLLVLLALLLLGGSLWPVRQGLLLLLTQPDFAHASGLPVRSLELRMLLAIGLVTGAAFSVLGVLCTTAALTCPGLIALRLAPSLRQSPGIAALAGLVAYLLGVILAFGLDWPTGPAIGGALVLLTLGAFGGSFIRRP